MRAARSVQARKNGSGARNRRQISTCTAKAGAGVMRRKAVARWRHHATLSGMPCVFRRIIPLAFFKRRRRPRAAKNRGGGACLFSRPRESGDPYAESFQVKSGSTLNLHRTVVMGPRWSLSSGARKRGPLVGATRSKIPPRSWGGITS